MNNIIKKGTAFDPYEGEISFSTKNQMKSYNMYMYLYPDGEVFGVPTEMIGYDYEPASLNDLINQNWFIENDFGRVLVLKNGCYLYENGYFMSYQMDTVSNQPTEDYIMYMYLYPDGEVFGVPTEMIGYDYEPASLNDAVKQNWCDTSDFGRLFIVKDGCYLYQNGHFKFYQTETTFNQPQKNQVSDYMYMYLYPNGELLGVANEMVDCDYELASLNDLVKQNWCDTSDFGKVFTVKEGHYLYQNERFQPYQMQHIEKNHIYLYPNGNLFGVTQELIGYDYELASLPQLEEQKWCDKTDFGKVFVVKDGCYLYEDYHFIPYQK